MSMIPSAGFAAMAAEEMERGGTPFRDAKTGEIKKDQQAALKSFLSGAVPGANFSSGSKSGLATGNIAPRRAKNTRGGVPVE